MLTTPISFFSRGIPFNAVDEVVDQFLLPDDERPSFIVLYFDQPDFNGHYYGPEAKEVTLVK